MKGTYKIVGSGWLYITILKQIEYGLYKECARVLSKIIIYRRQDGNVCMHVCIYVRR